MPALQACVQPDSIMHAGLLHGIEVRATRPEYGQLLGDCQRAYCAARLALVGGVTRARMAAFAREPLPTLTRSGCAYLMQARRPVPHAPPGTGSHDMATLHQHAAVSICHMMLSHA